MMLDGLMKPRFGGAQSWGCEGCRGDAGWTRWRRERCSKDCIELVAEESALYRVWTSRQAKQGRALQRKSDVSRRLADCSEEDRGERVKRSSRERESCAS